MAGIYLHIPFCKQACHYCDFHFSTRLSKKEAMIRALGKELRMRKTEFSGEAVETIYFGGGTPSLLEETEIHSLLREIYDGYNVTDDAEITLEANPDDLTEKGIAQMGSAGINRLSIGVQSFFDEDLTFLNRVHNAAQAESCIRAASGHIDNISIDLIYGIPFLTHRRWQENISKALSFNIPHISGYALTVEPKTALYHSVRTGRIPDIDEGVTRTQFYMLSDQLEREGYIHYELSNFGKEAYFSRNNTAYWLGKKYMGIGPSAHSFDGSRRSWNCRNNTKYINAIQEGNLPSGMEALTMEDRYNECILTGLRTIWGVSLGRITSEFGQAGLDYLERQARKHLESGQLYREDGKYFLSREGKFLADGIASDLFMVNLR